LPVLQGLDDEGRAARNGSLLVRAYHKAALECVTLVVISAAVALWLRLDAFDELWTTDYGRYVLVKFGVVLVALGFGWHHWRNMVLPEWDLDTAPRFQRSAASELIVGAIIAAVTVGLVATSLPTH
ncbi:MAG TPA: CopD family protein, partial [Gemmatimonadaceae bacterium]|nr:CopD family protein [Gemmatimonadaceae bacterium]